MSQCEVGDLEYGNLLIKAYPTLSNGTKLHRCVVLLIINSNNDYGMKGAHALYIVYVGISLVSNISFVLILCVYSGGININNNN